MVTNSDAPENEFDGVWMRFVAAARRLLAGAPTERVLDPYLPLRDQALAIAESPKLRSELSKAWWDLHESEDEPAPEVAHMLMMEFSALPGAGESWESEPRAANQTAISKDRVLGLAQTGLDSARDILKLSDWGKGALKIFSEVFDLFKSK